LYKINGNKENKLFYRQVLYYQTILNNWESKEVQRVNHVCDKTKNSFIP
jgi:hypothetical protein